jgi:hypothetical protein
VTVVWPAPPAFGNVLHLLEAAANPPIRSSPPELTTRLLSAARARVTEADAAEPSPAVTVARIGLAGPARIELGDPELTRDGLALLATSLAIVRPQQSGRSRTSPGRANAWTVQDESMLLNPAIDDLIAFP